MICTVLITKKQEEDTESPVFEWDEEEPGVIEVIFDYSDDQRAYFTVDREMLNLMQGAMLESESVA